MPILYDSLGNTRQLASDTTSANFGYVSQSGTFVIVTFSGAATTVPLSKQSAGNLSFLQNRRNTVHFRWIAMA
jgi:hypothetical protein